MDIDGFQEDSKKMHPNHATPIHQPHCFYLVLSILIFFSSFSLANNVEFYIHSRIGQDSPTCGMMESLPCKTIRYPIDNLMNNTNSGNNILIKLMNNWIGDCILFNNENVTIDSIHFMGMNRLVNLECSADQNQVKIPLVRFSNLNLNLVMFGVSQLEIFNCTIVDFVVNDIRRSLILDNIQVGTENLKQLLEKDSNIDLKKVIFNIFIELGSIDTSSKEVIVRNSHIIGCNLYVGSTLSNGSLLVENSTFEYSLLDLTNGLGYTPKSVPRPSFYITSSKFYRSSIQAREALSVTIQNCELIQNIPNKLSIVLSLIPNSIYAAFSVRSSAICNVLVSASVFSNCQSVGAMYLEGTGINAEVEWSHFKDNSNVKGGAAINLQTIYNLFAHNTIFENNKQVLDSSESLSNIKADERGGGAILQYQSLLTTESCIFINNEGITGGAVLNFQAHKYKSSVDVSSFVKVGLIDQKLIKNSIFITIQHLMEVLVHLLILPIPLVFIYTHQHLRKTKPPNMVELFSH